MPSRHRLPLLTMLLLGAMLGAGCKIELGALKAMSADVSLWNTQLSSDDARWRTVPPEGWPALTCAGAEAQVSDCCHLPPPWPQVDCQKMAAECDQELNQCVLYIVYQETATIDLLKEMPSLEAQKELIPQQILLKSVTSTFASDFVWPLPAVAVYVAPVEAKDITDAQAVYLTTVPGQNATVPLDEAAQRAFSTFAVDYRTPFKLLFASTIKVESGPAPQGNLAVQMTGRIEASFASP